MHLLTSLYRFEQQCQLFFDNRYFRIGTIEFQSGNVDLDVVATSTIDEGKVLGGLEMILVGIDENVLHKLPDHSRSAKGPHHFLTLGLGRLLNVSHNAPYSDQY